MSGLLRRYRVVLVEWLSHEGVIDAENPEAAEAQARLLWNRNAEHEVFRFEDSGIERVLVDELGGDPRRSA